MRSRGPALAALLFTAQCVNFCCLFAKADGLASDAAAQGTLGNDQVMQLLNSISVTMRSTDTVACRFPVVWKDDLLTNCKEATKVSPTPWCFTVGSNKRRACTAEEGATRPLSWFFTQHQGTDGLPGSLCSVAGGPVAGYNLTACSAQMSLRCSPMASGRLAGSGIGFCNFTTPGQSMEIAMDTRPIAMLGGLGSNGQAGQPARKDQAQGGVADQGSGGSVGGVSGLENIAVSTRVTASGGAPCKIPVVYKGALLVDCFTPGQGAPTPSCFTGSLDAPPQACKPVEGSAANATSALGDLLADGSAGDGSNGALCKLFADSSAGGSVANVTACAGGLVCTPLTVEPLAGSGFGFCARAAGSHAGAVDAALPASAGGTASLATFSVAMRSTVINETCRLPIVYGDSLLLDCVPLSAGSKVPECFVEGLSVVDECAPANTSALPLADMLGVGWGTDGSDGSLCSLSPADDPAPTVPCAPDMACMPLTGPMSGSGWGYCTQTKDVKGKDAAKEYYVMQRTAADGTPCRLPLISGGNLLLDCLLQNGTEWCFPENSDQLAQCTNVSQAVAMPLSTLMQSSKGMDGKRGSMCTDTGRFQGARVGCDAPLSCEAMIGPLLHSGYGYCTDLGLGKFGMTGAMRAARVAQRRAAGGVPCRLPLFYNGQLQTDCTPKADGSGAECYVAGQAAAQPCDAQQYGDPVKLPILMASGAAGDGGKGSICALARNATGPSDCGGALWCREAEVPPLHGSGYGWCTDEARPSQQPLQASATTLAQAQAQGTPVAMAPLSPLDGFDVAVRTTRDGHTCRLPVVYRGNLILDCRDFNESGVEQCFPDSTSNPQPCTPASSTQTYPPLKQVLASGSSYDGQEGSLCVLNTKLVAPGGKSPFLPASSGGGGCNLGLNCVSLSGPLDGSGYGYCALTVDGQQPINTGNVAGGLAGVRVAQRLTVDGRQCRLPVVYQGELIRDCRSLDGSSTLQCFVSGLDVAQDCADTRNYLTELAPALMAAGKGVDGQDGSLCTTVLATASPSSHRVLPCAAGFACLPLQAGGTAGSGVGYCTVLGQPSEDAAGAAAVRVSNRTAEDGRQCRLPVVYKGQVITGCVPVDGVDKCFTGDTAAGPTACAKAAGGYNLTAFSQLLAAGKGGDGRQGSMCDPKAPQSGVLACASGLLCVPLAKGPLAAAKFGYCATQADATAVLGAPAAPPRRLPECGKACIAGATLAGALLAALLVSGAWWLSVRRTRLKRRAFSMFDDGTMMITEQKRKSLFSKFDDAEFADVAAAYGDAGKPPKPTKLPPTRSETLSSTQPIHKSALQPPAPGAGSPPPKAPSRNPLRTLMMYSDTPSQPSIRQQASPPAPPQPTAASRVGGGNDPSAALLGANLSALAPPRAVNPSLTDTSPFAQTLERKSSAASAKSGTSEELPPAGDSHATAARSRFKPGALRGGAEGDIIEESDEDAGAQSGFSTSSSRSDVAFIKKD